MSWKSFIPKNFKLLLMLVTSPPKIFILSGFSSIPPGTGLLKLLVFSSNPTYCEHPLNWGAIQLSEHIGEDTLNFRKI